MTVVLTEPPSAGFGREALRRPDMLLLKLALLRRRGLVVVSWPTEDVSERAPSAQQQPEESVHVAVVPVARLDARSERALRYAVTVATEVIVLHVVLDGREDAEFEAWRERLTELWRQAAEQPHCDQPPRLLLIDSPYRQVLPALLVYLDSWRLAHPGPQCTVVLPELVVPHWWNQGLHNHRAFWLKAALLSRSNMAVADVTYPLREVL